MSANHPVGPATPHPAVERGQFFRVEKYAIQAPRGKQGGNNIYKVANEAVRTEGYCSHVEHPLPPTLLFGVSPMESASRAETWARQRTAQVFHKPSQTLKDRKIRDDQPCALAGVISVPPEWVADSRWVQFCGTSLAWLKEKYDKGRLQSVIEHLDERCLHLHFWVVPRPQENFSSIHQGEKALDEVGRKAARAVRDAAYKKAMAKLLDEFHQRVGSPFGLERETVQGNRLKRADWLRKQYLDRQRELDVQKRIDVAVAAAIRQLQVDQGAMVEQTKQIGLPLNQTGATQSPALAGTNRNRTLLPIGANPGSQVKIEIPPHRTMPRISKGGPDTTSPEAVALDVAGDHLEANGIILPPGRSTEWVRSRSG